MIVNIRVMMIIIIIRVMMMIVMMIIIAQAQIRKYGLPAAWPNEDDEDRQAALMMKSIIIVTIPIIINHSNLTILKENVIFPF